MEIFCLIDDETLRNDSLKLIEDLRTTGLAVDYSLIPTKSDKQFKRAQELKASFTVKLQREEQGELRVKLRNLKTREEKILNVSDIIPEIQSSAK